MILLSYTSRTPVHRRVVLIGPGVVISPTVRRVRR